MMLTPVKLHNWFLTHPMDLLPRSNALGNCVLGFDDAGRELLTPPIVDVCETEIICSNGQVFSLGEASPEYINFCGVNGFYIPTEENPLQSTGEFH